MSRLAAPRARIRTTLATALVGATLAAAGSPSSVGAAPVARTFVPTADARVEQAHPSKNYGTAKLGVDQGASSTANSYLSFTASGLSAPVQSARLRLRVQNNGSGGGSALYPVTGGWTERAITWKNAPPGNAQLASSAKLPANSWVEYDVTRAVGGNGTYSFVLKLASGTDGADIASREQASPPQLVVVTDGPADTQPPTAAITYPVAGATLSGTVQVTATAADDTGVTAVTLTVDGADAATDTTAPYAFGLDTTALADGGHTLRVRARDATGNTGSSAEVAVTVSNAPPPPPPSSWRSGNAYGAGYMNSVRFHPTDPNRLLLNTDVAGIHLSTDGGTTWQTRGRNVADRVASAVWHPTLPDVAYALAGNGTAGSGGVMVSGDGGMNWRLDSATPTGHSNNTPSADGLPIPHPRSTGQLLVVDSASGFLYAGTYRQGLMRAPLDAAGDPGAWTTVALAPSGGTPYFIRGIALDDQEPGTVYVATRASSAGLGTGHVYRVAQAGTANAVVSELAGSPRNAEELRSLGGHLYAVANDRTGAGVGAFRLAAAAAAPAGTAWRRLAAGPSVETVTYYGLEIYKRGSTTTLWVTSDKAWRPTSDVAYKPMWRGTSTDDFATDGSWAALPDRPGDTPNDIAGPNAAPERWWALADNTYAWLGNDPIYTASTVTVSPTDPDTLVLAGQGGPWRTRDNGRTWYPVPTGVSVLVQTRVTADPVTAGRVYVGALDYRGFSTTDALRTPAHHLGGALRTAGVPNQAGDTWSVAVDSAAAGSVRPVYFGLGERDVNTFGQIWMDADPTTPTSGWTRVLDTATSGGKRPIGLAVVRDPAAPATPVVLAVLQGGGLYRKAGGGAWTTASGFTSPIVNGLVFPQAVEFAWRPGWSKVYAYDRSSGLWRSGDFGLSWTKLTSSPDTGTNRQGFLAAHPTDEDIVYLSTSAGVSVVADAGTAGPGGATLTSLGVPTGRPGPVAVGSDGRIYVAAQPTGTGSLARLYAGRLTASGLGVVSPWADLADDVYTNAINGPREMAVDAGGTVYVSTSGGVFVLDGGAG